MSQVEITGNFVVHAPVVLPRISSLWTSILMILEFDGSVTSSDLTALSFARTISHFYVLALTWPVTTS